MIPHHHENMIPAFVKDGTSWKSSNRTPFVYLVGCRRKVKMKIGCLGDSIIQGIGTDKTRFENSSREA